MFSIKNISIGLVLALASSVNAQATGGLPTTDILNPALSEACKNAASGLLVKALTSCNLAELLPLASTAQKDPLAAVGSAINSPTFLTNLCGTDCTNTINSIGSSLSSCGNTPLFVSNATTPASSPVAAASGLTAGDLAGISKYAQNVMCIKTADNKQFCLQDRFAVIKQQFPNNDVTVEKAIANEKVACSACSKALSDAASKTDGVPANIVSEAKPALDAFKARLGQCPAGSLTASSTQSSAGQTVVVGSSAALAVAAAALLA
ncbi:hypothetical protein SpCBS45565_g01438 [Spizellomyces sp. 'palustris']|nr:hypothetical protein SpCBS45565_g01438 [Spizellomyces sp. 'palustris']